jgi:hypothetical protein
MPEIVKIFFFFFFLSGVYPLGILFSPPLKGRCPQRLTSVVAYASNGGATLEHSFGIQAPTSLLQVQILSSVGDSDDFILDVDCG